MQIPEHIIRDGVWWRNTIDGSSMALVESGATRFLIDRMVVSNARFQRFLTTTGEQVDRGDVLVLGEDGFPAEYPVAPEWSGYPAMLVPHDVAERYATWCGGALPTIAEWRLAAYGETARRYPWGDDWNGGPCQSAERSSVRPIPPEERELWFSHPEYFEKTMPPTAPSDAFPDGASPFGLLGCAGNIHEWCAREPDQPHAPALGGCYTWFAEDLVAEKALVRFPVTLAAPTVGFRCVIRINPYPPTAPPGSR